MSKTKYTKEILEPAVRESLSYAEVIRKLGLRQSGGAQSHIKRRIVALGINCSHFLGQARNRGRRNAGAFKKREWQHYLVHGKRVEAFLLRRSLIENGREYKCEKCSNTGWWNGKPLVLQVDHKNGDNCDNRPENIRFLCPNCHSLTDNWCGKGIKKPR